MDVLLLQYIIMIIVTCDPPQDHTDSTAWWQVITWCLLFALYSGLMMDLFQFETCNQVFERGYELCFDWWFVWFPSLIYNTTGCVPLRFVCSCTYSIVKLPVPQTKNSILHFTLQCYRTEHWKLKAIPVYLQLELTVLNIKNLCA
jgi:hypothetical protein